MRRIITVTVTNQSGVLNRVTGLMMKRQFNIESITVGHTESPLISKMTFVVHVEDAQKIEQLLKQLQKQIDVLKVHDLTDQSIVIRELALIKVQAPASKRLELNALIEPFRVQTIDAGKHVVTYQITGHPDKIDAFVELVKPYGILELTRTGVTAFTREHQRSEATPIKRIN